MIIHDCSEVDFRENNFSANFSSVSVFQCEAFGQSPLESGRVRLRRPDGQVTRPDARGSTVCLCGIPRLDGLVMRPDGYHTGFSIDFFALAATSRHYFLLFSLDFLHFLVHFFLCFLTSSRPLLSFSAFYLIFRYFVLSFTFFSVLLTVRIFLWNIFEIKIA
jgi:hypothetical protein